MIGADHRFLIAGPRIGFPQRGKGTSQRGRAEDAIAAQLQQRVAADEIARRLALGEGCDAVELDGAIIKAHAVLQPEARLARGEIARQHDLQGVGPGEVLPRAVGHREFTFQVGTQIPVVVRPREQHQSGVLHEGPINDDRHFAVELEIAQQTAHLPVSQRAEPRDFHARGFVRRRLRRPHLPARQRQPEGKKHTQPSCSARTGSRLAHRVKTFHFKSVLKALNSS